MELLPTNITISSTSLSSLLLIAAVLLLLLFTAYAAGAGAALCHTAGVHLLLLLVVMRGHITYTKGIPRAATLRVLLLLQLLMWCGRAPCRCSLLPVAVSCHCCSCPRRRHINHVMLLLPVLLLLLLLLTQRLSADRTDACL